MCLNQFKMTRKSTAKVHRQIASVWNSVAVFITFEPHVENVVLEAFRSDLKGPSKTHLRKTDKQTNEKHCSCI